MVPYILRSARGGISDENDKGIAHSFKFGHGLDIHNRKDTLRPGSAMLTIFDGNNTTLTGHFNAIVPASDGSTYLFGATGSIFAMSSDLAFTNVYNDDEGITGAAEWGLSDGRRYLFWGKSTSIARRPLQGYSGVDPARDSGQALWADATQVWKTEHISSSAVWRTMKPASGALMIANGESLATVDFDGEFDPGKLNIRPGNTINTIEERGDFVTLGTQRDDESEEGHLWSWIVTALNYVEKKKIPVKGINALITAETALLQGGDNGEIFPADFTNSVPLATVPGGGKVNPGSVDTFEDLAVFGFYAGTDPGIWSYGRRNRNRNSVLNYQYRLSPTVDGSTLATIGAVAVVNGELYSSWGTTETDGSAYGLDVVSSSTRADALYEGLEFDKGQAFNRRGFDTVKAVFDPLPSGTSFSLKYKADMEDNWRYAVFGDGGTTYSTANATHAIASVKKPAHIFEAGVELNSSGSDGADIHEIAYYLADETNAY